MNSSESNTASTKIARQIPIPAGVVMVFILGFALSLAAFFLVHSWEQSETRSLFEIGARNHLAAIRKEIISHEEVVSSISALFPASQYVSREEFRTFVQGRLSAHPDISGLSWNPLIKHPERKSFEEKTRQEGFWGFQITELGADNQRHKATARDYYVVVHYIEPYAGNEEAHGFDIASDPARLVAIEKARDSGEAVITERIKLVQEKEDRFGYLLFKAVYRTGTNPKNLAERKKHFVGVAVGVFRFGDFISQVMQHTKPLGVDILITDLSAPPEKQFLHFHPSRTREEAFTPTAEDRRQAEQGLHLQTTIDVLGRKWSLLFAPAPAFLQANPLWQSWVVFVLGLLITVLLALFLLTKSRHLSTLAAANSELQQEISERREVENALQASEELQRLTLTNISDAIFITDNEGKLTYVCPNVNAIFGYSVEEIQALGNIERLLGHPVFDPQELDQSGQIHNIEIKARDKDGNECVLLTHVKKVSIMNGTLLYSCRDITDRKRAEEQYRYLFERTGTGMAVVEADGTLSLVNRTFEQLAEGSESDIIGRPFLEGVVAEDKARMQEYHLKRIRGESAPESYEFRFKSLKGREGWGLMNLAYFKDSKTTLASVIDITERKRTEQALRESEQTNRAIIDTSRDWIWSINLEGIHTYSNPAAEEILGYTQEELTCRNIFEMIHEDDKKWTQELLTESIEKQQGWNNIVVRWCHKNGEYRYLESNGVPHFDVEGDLVGFRGVDRDITERKKAEQELANIFNLSPDIIGLGNMDGHFLRINQSVEKVLGYTEEEFLSKSFLEFIHDDDIEKTKQAMSDAIAGKRDISIYNRYWCKDGSCKWIDWRVLSLAEEGRFYAVGRDITEQKVTEDKLRQAAAVYENTAEGIFITDEQANIVAVNQAITEITGFSEEEALGHNPRLWKSDRHDQAYFNTMWSSLEQTGKWRGEIWNRRKNGEAFPCWQTITAIKDDQDKITHYVSVLTDISVIKESEMQLEYLAHHDPLTDLPNRVLFNARLSHALEKSHRDMQMTGVLFLDLDNFKPINDAFGHPVGDMVLQEAAKRLLSQVREDDTVARISGDEFAIIIEDISDHQSVADVAGKIKTAFEAPLKVDSRSLHVTVSIGISLFPDDGWDVNNLVKNADAAMYASKQRGKNRFSFYTDELTASAQKRVSLENDLRAGLIRNEFRVYYQPQYDLDTGRLIGAEALLRWQHSEQGLVSPIQFIPLAESTGLIIPLGEWVLREACAQVKTWQEAGLGIERIGVNVAGQQIQRSDFVTTVRKALQETGLEPNCLELEVTESFIMGQSEDAINTLKELRNLGVHLAIDDFGTGYSSLSYLKRLPINKIKIDRSFVKDIPQDPDDEAITKAVIAMGKSLQLKIIAEGVETEEQLSFLKSEGCDEVQGFLYSPPVPEHDFAMLFKKN